MAKKELTKVEQVYIDARKGKDSEADIARELGITVKRVKDHIQTSPARKSVAKTKFAVHPSGAVSMTEQQSMDDDARSGIDPMGKNLLSPAQTKAIAEKMEELSTAQISEQMGIPLHTVDHVVRRLKGLPVDGREAFYQRNHRHLHKIDPDAPHR